MDYIAMANAALEKRARAFEQRKAVLEDKTFTDADKRTRVEAIDAEMDALYKEAESHVRAAEGEAETRALNERGAVLAAGRNRSALQPGEWRGLIPSRGEWAEHRALAEGVDADGGYTVPKQVHSNYISLLRQRSAFLQIPGLNVVPMTSNVLRIPQLSATDGVTAPTAEGTAITEDDSTWTGPEMTAFGYKALTKASNEVLADSALPLRQIIAAELGRDISGRIDTDAFGTATSGKVLGIFRSGANTKTTLTSGNTAVTWSHVISAMTDIEANGGRATAVIANAAMGKGLRLERENQAAGTGAYLAGPVTDDPTSRAAGLKLIMSNRVPARSVAVVDGSRLYYGLRSTVLRVSEEAFFANDQVGIRLVVRAAGVIVAEASSVQWLEAASA